MIERAPAVHRVGSIPCSSAISTSHHPVGEQEQASGRSDAVPQWKGQLGPFLVPGPTCRQVRHDRAQTVLRHVLVEHDQIIEYARHGG